MAEIVNTRANQIRAALKQAGFSARQVTVRERHEALHVSIRQESVSLTKVQAIAKQFEVVRRDHATGEVLCGGNTYVRVEYVDAVVAPIKAAILAVLEPAPSDEYVSLPGGFRAMKCTRGAYPHLGEVRMRGPGFDLYNDHAVGVTWAAARLAVAYLDATATGTSECPGAAEQGANG